MSRFTHNISEDEYVAYGLDMALGYFADVFVKFIDDEGYVTQEVTKSVTGRSKVIDLFTELDLLGNINKWHINSICMDIPLASSREEYDQMLRKVLG